MNHLTDDELLELALLGPEGREERAGHLKSCLECAARFESVEAEQHLLRDALAEPDPPARVLARMRGEASPRSWKVAAAVLAAAALATAAYALGRHSSRPRAEGPRSARSAHPLVVVKEISRRVDALNQKMAEAREELLQPAGHEVTREYLGWMTEAVERYSELLESYCDMAAPLTLDQQKAIRDLLVRFHSRMKNEKDRRKPVEEYKEAVREILSKEQYGAFEDYLRQETDIAWNRDVELLLEDLAEALNLRFSEVEPLRKTLVANYPKTELLMIPVWECPPDLLCADSMLAHNIRKSLKPDYHAAFDHYLERARRARDGARAIALKYGDE